MTEQKIQLSVAVITKNEEEKLPDCLKSISFADDIVVVDSGSTDKTAEIAENFGCRVFVEEWKGYGPQKNSAVQKCRNEWVLIVDADERIPDETKKEIKEVIGNPESADAYSFPRKNFFHGKWIKHGGWWPDESVRLVRRNAGKFHGLTHEIWVTGGRLKRLDVPIEHYSFKNYSDMLKKLDEYSTLTSHQLHESGARSHLLAPVFHCIAMFFKSYILRLGFLDGFDGLIIAITAAEGSFFKYAKLLEMQRYE